MRQKRALIIAAAVASSLAVALGPAGAAHASYPGADGRLAFAMTDTTGPHIYTVRSNGQDLDQLTHGAYFDACPSYSATGRQLAFCSNRSGSFEIWTMNTNGHRLHQLTDLTSATFPDFSPGGGRIAFDGQVSGDSSDELFVVNSDGSDTAAAHLRRG